MAYHIVSSGNSGFIHLHNNTPRSQETISVLLKYSYENVLFRSHAVQYFHSNGTPILEIKIQTLCNHQNMSMEAITPTYGNDVLCYRCHTRVAFVYMMEVIELMFYFLVGPYFQRQFYSATSLDSVVIAHIELQCPI